MKHTHDDDRLTFACPACIDTVQEDQRRAEILEQPERPLTVAWSINTHGIVTIDAKYLDDEQPSDVAERYQDVIADAIVFDDMDVEVQEAAFGKKIAKGRRR